MCVLWWEAVVQREGAWRLWAPKIFLLLGALTGIGAHANKGPLQTRVFYRCCAIATNQGPLHGGAPEDKWPL